EWLAAQVGATTEDELNSAVEQMGEEGLQQAFQQFQQEQSTQALKQGGRIAYMQKLIAFRKGGKGPSTPNSTKAKMVQGSTKNCSATGGRKDAKQAIATALGKRTDAPKKETTAYTRL